MTLNSQLPFEFLDPQVMKHTLFVLNMIVSFSNKLKFKKKTENMPLFPLRWPPSHLTTRVFGRFTSTDTGEQDGPYSANKRSPELYCKTRWMPLHTFKHVANMATSQSMMSQLVSSSAVKWQNKHFHIPDWDVAKHVLHNQSIPQQSCVPCEWLVRYPLRLLCGFVV